MIPSIRSIVGAGLLALSLAPALAIADAVSVSPHRTLTAEEYRDFLHGFNPEERQRVTADRERLRDLVLDFHSDVVLAEEAERLGLTETPEVAARLARARRQLLVQALMAQATDAVQLPDAAGFETLARERFALRKDQLRAPERRRIAHILLADPADCPCNTDPPALERAATLREELLAGTDFAEAAAAHSRDSGTAAGGGELPGWVEEDGRLVRPFERAAFALEAVGEISAPVETRFGVHLIKLLELEPSRQLEFEEVKDPLIRQLTNELRASAREQRRSGAYPDPTTINLDLLEQVVAELRQAE